MPAPDSRPRAARLSDAALAAMRDAVLAVWVDHPHGDPALVDAVACLCADARARGLGAEEVIVALKTLLAAMPELLDDAHRLEAARLQDRIVTLAIGTYYEG